MLLALQGSGLKFFTTGCGQARSQCSTGSPHPFQTTELAQGEKFEHLQQMATISDWLSFVLTSDF